MGILITIFVCCAFVCVCLYVPCCHLLGKGWLLGSRLWCIIVNMSLSHWNPGLGVVLDCINSWSLHPYLFLKNTKKKSQLIYKFYLTQLIIEPTHYTETSTSTIDLILVRNNTNVLCSGVADSFIPEQVRHNCPTIVILKFLRAYMPAYKRRIWDFQLADCEKYKGT